MKAERRVSLAGDEDNDEDNDDRSLRDALRSSDVRMLLRHRLFAHDDRAHDAQLDGELHGRRLMTRPFQSSSGDSVPLSVLTRGTASSVNPC